MAHGAVRQAPYYAILVLSATFYRHEHYFDGWCAARGVDPMTLPFRRLLNLIHYVVREMLAGDKDKTEEFERSLTQGVRADGRPSWFSDDAEAAQSSLAAARALGLQV